MNRDKNKIVVYAPLGIGGVSSLMTNIQKKLDREKLNFDYLVVHDRKEPMEDLVVSLGSKKIVAAADEIKFRPLRTVVRFFRIIKECKRNDIKVLHFNGGAPMGLFTIVAAKFGGVKHITFHSHNGGMSNEGKFVSL